MVSTVLGWYPGCNSFHTSRQLGWAASGRNGRRWMANNTKVLTQTKQYEKHDYMCVMFNFDDEFKKHLTYKLNSTYKPLKVKTGCFYLL